MSPDWTKPAADCGSVGVTKHKALTVRETPRGQDTGKVGIPMYRITVTDLRNRAAALSKLMDTPIHLTTWSPGDGWTRYQLTDADQQPLQPFGAKYYRLHEMAAFLDGAIMVYDRGKGA
jgi:hypothetical protein